MATVAELEKALTEAGKTAEEAKAMASELAESPWLKGAETKDIVAAVTGENARNVEDVVNNGLHEHQAVRDAQTAIKGQIEEIENAHFDVDVAREAHVRVADCKSMDEFDAAVKSLGDELTELKKDAAKNADAIERLEEVQKELGKEPKGKIFKKAERAFGQKNPQSFRKMMDGYLAEEESIARETVSNAGKAITDSHADATKALEGTEQKLGYEAKELLEGAGAKVGEKGEALLGATKLPEKGGWLGKFFTASEHQAEYLRSGKFKFGQIDKIKGAGAIAVPLAVAYMLGGKGQDQQQQTAIQ